MSKKLRLKETNDYRSQIKRFYDNKYYNLFLNKFEWQGLDSYDQQEWLMRKLWFNGVVGAIKIKNSETELNPGGLLAFTLVAGNGLYSIYDYPTTYTLINTRGAPFIPSTPQVAGKDVVIGYIQPNRAPVALMVDTLISKLVDVEMTMRLALKVQKMPWLITADPEYELALKEVWDSLNNDEPVIFTAVEVDKLKILLSGAPYIIDKLRTEKEAIEAEIREYLGLDSLGMQNKKEHLITAEVDSNKEITKNSAAIFLECLTRFCENIKNAFGIDISVKEKQEAPDYDESDEPIIGDEGDGQNE